MHKLAIGLTAGLGIIAIGTSAAAIEPGNWEATVQATDIQLPASVPAQVRNMMQSMLGDQSRSSTSCITQEDLDEAPERMFRESNGECRYTEFDMAGGRLHGVAQCRTDQGTMNMRMDGTYTDTTYAMTMAMDGDAGMGPMTMTFDVAGRRLGPCEG